MTPGRCRPPHRSAPPRPTSRGSPSAGSRSPSVTGAARRRGRRRRRRGAVRPGARSFERRALGPAAISPPDVRRPAGAALPAPAQPGHRPSLRGGGLRPRRPPRRGQGRRRIAQRRLPRRRVRVPTPLPRGPRRARGRAAARPADQHPHRRPIPPAATASPPPPSPHRSAKPIPPSGSAGSGRWSERPRPNLRSPR